MKKLTVDSSIIISSLLKNEPRHKEALLIWEDVMKGKCFVINPFSVLVEVVAAIRRRTGLASLAMEVKKELIDTENVSFVILDDKSAIEAAEIAAKTGLRGMDALVVQVAKEYNSELISFDKEMMRKSRAILKKR
ncbi:MAG: type II toxin-antitoxin system VapC family toxin [Candidatus Brocadiaceae bacterium]|nr:type II toxin-antitoxin system VapC family toxin [Candidatus Brocadiaceae bacterium]